MSQWPYTTQRWQRLRRHKLRENPLCEYCLNAGQLEVATVVDHIIPIVRGGDPYPPLDHLMSCCPSHHNQKTRGEQQGKESFTPKGIKGCDVYGNPLDPNHPWYKIMTDDDAKPTGYDTLHEAVAVIIEHEAARARARPNSSRGRLSLPKFVNPQPQRRPLGR